MLTALEANRRAAVERMARRATLPPNRRVRVGSDPGTGESWVQVQGYVADLTDPLNPGPMSWQGGGKRRVSQYACENEFFQMLLAMVLAFDEHETREAFLVDGRRVFNPHISLEALKRVCDDVEVRH